MTTTTTDAPARPAATRPERAPLAWAPVLVVVLVKVVLNLLVSARYGWHRDELYYADAGRHLAWGFVDFPPVTPLLAAGARVLAGDTLVGLRAVASLAGAGVILVTAAITRDLGGRRRAQVLAAVAICPLLVGSNAMFQTVSFDQLAWALVIWAAVALLQVATGPDDDGEADLGRAWVALAAAVALAWATKSTSGVLVGALAIGWLATASGRRSLRGAGPWVGAALVAGAALPNLWWQARHGWATVAFFAGRNGAVRNDNPPWRFAVELVLITGPVAVPLAVVGLRALLRDIALRPLGVALALVVPAWLVLGGKSYYAAPIVVGAFAAGAVEWERRAERRGRTSLRLPVAIVLTTWLCLPLIGPFLPTATMVRAGLPSVRDDYAAELGWPELAATTDSVWDDLSPAEQDRTVVLAGSYGSAGALVRFSHHPDLPVVSGHLTHRDWALPDRADRADRALVVGFDPRPLQGICRGPVRTLARVTNRWGVDNEEAGRPVLECELDASVAVVRDRLADG